MADNEAGAGDGEAGSEDGHAQRKCRCRDRRRGEEGQRDQQPARKSTKHGIGERDVDITFGGGPSAPGSACTVTRTGSSSRGADRTQYADPAQSTEKEGGWPCTDTKGA